MMMGGWFVATAIGNYLVSIGSNLWGDMPLWGVWSVFVAVCAIAAIFMYSMMKKLEDATK
jgi:POT family proton-dependent oligopeptide transporter